MLRRTTIKSLSSSYSSSSASSSSSPSSSSSSFSSFPFYGSRIDPRVSCRRHKRGDWVGFTRSTLFPQQLLNRTAAWTIEPDFHWRGLVGQFATGHQHLPQFWISARWIVINLGAESLCAPSPSWWGLQPWASTIIIIIIITFIFIIIDGDDGGCGGDMINVIVGASSTSLPSSFLL